MSGCERRHRELRAKFVALDVNPDGQASFATAGHDEQGRLHVEVARFVICKRCKYHMEPRLTVDGLCVNAARCEGRVRDRKRDKQAAGKKPW